MTYNWQEALAVGSILNAMQRHAGAIGLATWAQVVNVIAPIRADRKGSVRQTVFHPLALYAKHGGQWSVTADCQSPALDPAAKRPAAALDVSATLGADGKTLTLAVVNRHATEAVAARIQINGASFKTLQGASELTALSMTASNSLAHPDQDCVQTRTLARQNWKGEYTFPARSITMLTLN